MTTASLFMLLFTPAVVALWGQSRCGGPETVRQAVLANDPSLIGACLPDRDRVLVSGPPLRAAAPRSASGAFLGPGPLRAFLARTLADRRTIAFDLIENAAPSSDRHMMHATARWRYRQLPSGRVRNERMSMTFRRASEDEQWHLLEIRFTH